MLSSSLFLWQRRLLVVLLSMMAATAGPIALAAEQILHIGYQKNNTLVLLR